MSTDPIPSLQDQSQLGNSFDLTLAYCLLRIHLGVNIAFHGISRLIGGPNAFSGKLTQQFSSTLLPGPLVAMFGHALPFLEAAIGLAVLAGFKTRVALVSGALLMIVLTFGSTLNSDFQAAGLQLPYAIAYFILIALHQQNRWSFDGLMNPKSI